MYALSYETMEVTGPQMVLTMKLTTFAWNVWDGRRPAEVCAYIRPAGVNLIAFLGHSGSG